MAEGRHPDSLGVPEQAVKLGALLATTGKIVLSIADKITKYREERESELEEQFKSMTWPNWEEVID